MDDVKKIDRVTEVATVLIGQDFEGIVEDIDRLSKEELVNAINKASADIVRQPDGSLVMVSYEDRQNSEYYELDRMKDGGWRIEGKSKVFASKTEAFAAICKSWMVKADVD